MVQNLSKPFIPFGKRLFFSVMLLYLVFSAAFLGYQYRREKDFKTELLNTKLQDYNDRLYDEINKKDSLSLVSDIIETYIAGHDIEGLRVTIITADGEVMYDNIRRDFKDMENHSQRIEVQKALINGNGHDIQRSSESIGIEYFYSATYYPDSYIIRSALPYDITLISSLEVDHHFIWFTIIATIILTILFYRYTQMLGDSVSRLYEFTQRAERDEPIEEDIDEDLPDTELGEISRHIIRLYSHLHETKEELYIEREKLITHLQTSREGLGIFTAEGKEILVNPLFTQYTNLISDTNLSETEEIFEVPELKEISAFIRKSQSSTLRWGEKRMEIHLDKNGKSFAIECIIFQDHSFEISITDITNEKEQVDIKRQLTQNAAHELKTPVSSIQGYLETIVNNKSLSPEKMNMFLERCYAQSNRLSRLLRDISVLTRMDEAPGMFDMEKVDISLMMKNILNEVAMELEEKEIKVCNELNDIHIRGNSSLIYSIFRNLTDNAIAYAGTGFTITIKCFREDDNYYYFSFADTGVGISPEHLNRLFERFYRVDKGRSRKMGGTGLGLAIVKNAVFIHGGNISAKNNQGGGLEFIFTLGKN